MSNNPTYIIGHQNPDADSICSAIAYSDFKQSIGETNCLPARCGNSNPRIDSILDHFNVPLPLFIGDVTPRVKDVMVPLNQVHIIHPEATCAEALEMIETFDDRALAVIDKHGHVSGLISIFKLGEYFIPKISEPKKMPLVQTDLNSIVRSLKATPLNVLEGDLTEDLYVRVAATEPDSLSEFLEREGIAANKNVIVVGNHKAIQEKAIELGVRLLVITHEVAPHILNIAKEKGISVIRSPYDSATTAWVIRSANYIKPLIQKEVVSFSPDEKLSTVKRKVANSFAPIYFVTDEDNKLQGIFSKSDLLKSIATNLILVDHNELTQAVNGAQEVNILEIIDHHKLGNPNTNYPIRFINEPVGSTCTIVANMFHRHNITPSPAIAGVMMGGIITDTLNLNSPTTTDVDRQLLPWLGQIAGIDHNAFAEKIFSSGSIILNAKPENVIESDCKLYRENDINYSASQIEELGFANFWKHAEALTTALEKYRKRNGLVVSFLLITDINTQDSLLIVKGDQDLIDQINYPQVEKYPNIFKLRGVVSRKKQLIPYLTALISESGLTII